MPANGVWYFIQWLHYLALSLWIGGIAFFSGVAAPAAHRSMASKTVAGEIVGRMLKRLNIIELTCCALLLVTSFSSFRFIHAREKYLWILIFLIALMGSFTLFYTYHITPRMESLKVEVPTLDSLSTGQHAKLEFDRLHKEYVRLMSLNLALGLAVLYGSIVILK